VEAAATPEGIALRASREIYQALAPTDFPSSSDGDKYGALLVSALEARKEDPERALQLLDLYLLERGDDIAALQFQAALRGQLKHYVEMAEAAEQLVRLQGDDPIAYLWRGLARLLLNRIEPCLEDFSRAKGFDATATWAEALQGLALIRLGQPTDGIAALDRALAGSPNMVVAILGRASAYRSMADLTAAVGELNRVIELEPDNANALAARGEDHRELGNLDAAKQDFEQAMALAGRSPTMVMRYLSVVSQKWEIQQAETAEAEARRKAEEEKPPDEASKQRILDWFSQYVWP
jgi:tetratricopeptide (TPR) repeat protein